MWFKKRLVPVECYSTDRDNFDENMRTIKEHDLPIKIIQLGQRKNKKSRKKITYLPGLSPVHDPDFEIDTTDDSVFLAEYTGYSNTLNNLLDACINRVFLVTKNGVLMPPHEPLQGIFKQIHPLADCLAQKLDDHKLMSLDQWVEDSPAHRRECYRIAAENLKANGMLKAWEHIKLFTKFQREKLGKAPRVICPPCEEAIAWEGVYVKSVEKPSGGIMSLYGGIDELWQDEVNCVHPVCSKGFTSEVWATILYRKWNEFSDPCEIDFDCSRFSQHTRKDALDLFLYLVTKIFPDAANELENKDDVLGKADVPDQDGILNRVSVKLPCMLNDGTPKTAASAHVIINLLMIYYFRQTGLAIEPMDCGDDFSIICDIGAMPNLDHMQDFMHDYGYILKVETEEPIRIFNNISFCRQSPVFVDGHWTMIRPPSCLFKDAMMMCMEREARDRMFAVGMGGCHANKGVPVYECYYRSLVRLSGLRKFKNKHLAFLYVSNYSYYTRLKEKDLTKMTSVDERSVQFDKIKYSDEDRNSFELTTGVPHGAQVELEALYNNIEIVEGNKIPGRYWSPW
jgi:hypothetical protein